MLTVKELKEFIDPCPNNMLVVLSDPDTNWLLHLTVDQSEKHVWFTTDYSDENRVNPPKEDTNSWKT